VPDATLSTLLWIGGLVAAIILGLVGVVYTSLRKSEERTDKRLDEHIYEDVKAHERLARLETKVEQHDVEIQSLRDRWHDFRDITLRKVADMFKKGD
jgi:hypothetical protein